MAVVLALCGPKVARQIDEPFVVFATDRSASVAPDDAEAMAEFIEQSVEQGGGGRMVILPFATRPGEPSETAGAAATDLDREGTNLAAAIEVAGGCAPLRTLPRMVLFSDGLETEGDAMAAARAAEMPIWSVPLRSRCDPEVYVSTVRVRDGIRDGEPFLVEAIIDASRAGVGRATLFRDSRGVGGREVRLEPGENRVGFVQSVVGLPAVTFTIQLTGFEDTIAENNSASGVAFFDARPRVLLVENRPNLSRRLAAALSQQHIDVEVRSPERFPDSLSELERFDLVILSNIPAASLSVEQMTRIRQYVAGFGGGLIAVGGDQAFTPGGYRGTILEEVLPVRCEPREERQRPSLAMVLVIDRSTSMEGAAIELAKQATRRAIEVLDPRDQVGVLTFEEVPTWISPIHPCSDKAPVLARIETIRAGGRTDSCPALERAYLALDEAFADHKHIILLTDGISHPGDFEQVTARIAKAGITLSTVAVGKEAAGPLLEDLARIGHGRYYYCDDPAAVPKIFALDTASAARVGINERPFFAKVARFSRVLSGLDFDRVPSLLGYVETKPKPGSQLILTSEAGDPLLVWWRYGFGTAVAFTSDVRSRWAAAWLRWPGFDPFWVHLVRHALRKDPARDFVLRAEQEPGRIRVSLDAVDPEGGFLNGARGELSVVDPRKQSREIEVEQVAPGRYEAEFAAVAPGTYLVEMRLHYRGELAYAGRRGMVVGFADEFRTRPADDALLQSVARVSGGRYDPKPADVFAPDERTRSQTTNLRPYLLAVAALLFVVDVALRRLVFAGVEK